MQSEDITYDQAWKIDASLRPQLDYLFQLTKRMESQGFPPDDPLLCDAQQALDAIRQLTNRVRSLAVKGTGYDIKGR